mmetsp:Transcript_32690/g.28952  ORF Transcript_32690/g.28952 Transcript_32690/m.28952 type:complete len:112 (-) Transcript_32690:117-452(-)
MVPTHYDLFPSLSTIEQNDRKYNEKYENYEKPKRTYKGLSEKRIQVSANSSKTILKIPPLMKNNANNVTGNSRGHFKKFTVMPKSKAPGCENHIADKRKLMRTEKLRLYGF